jgi:hypothetical protein
MINVSGEIAGLIAGVSFSVVFFVVVLTSNGSKVLDAKLALDTKPTTATETAALIKFIFIAILASCPK